MSKNTSLVLIIWNILLTGLVGWGLFKNNSQGHIPVAADGDESTEMVEQEPITPRDPAALKEAHIAFFYMDSVQRKYELIAEKDKRFRTEGQRLESSLQNEMAKAQARYQELMEKDHTYSTQAEVAKDEQELQGLMQRIQGQQARSEEQLAKLEGEMLTEITSELKSHLEMYNKEAGFDYIFSVQNGGQVWVGNEDLDITNELVKGLNAKYRAKKGPLK